MNSQQVVNQVRFYHDARQNIRNDRNLSPQGIERALKNLEQSITLFRAQALDALGTEWKGAARQYKNLAERRLKAERDAAGAWNYNQLAYESQAVTAHLSGIYDVAQAGEYLEGVLRGGNQEKARAAAEIAPAILRKNLAGQPGLGSLLKNLETSLAQLLDTPELKAVRDAENQEGLHVVQLAKDTQEVKAFYGSGSNLVFGVRDDFSKLMEGWNVEERGLSWHVEYSAPAAPGVPSPVSAEPAGAPAPA